LRSAWWQSAGPAGPRERRFSARRAFEAFVVSAGVVAVGIIAAGIIAIGMRVAGIVVATLASRVAV
jgi:hypothetical protein